MERCALKERSSKDSRSDGARDEKACGRFVTATESGDSA